MVEAWRAGQGDAWRWASLTGLFYLGLGWLSIGLSEQPGSIAALWFANAVGVAALTFAPRGARLGVVAALVVAGGLSNWPASEGWWHAMRLVPANLVEIFLAAYLLRRRGLHAHDVRSPRRMGVLLLWGGLLPSAVGAAVGALILGLVDGVPLPEGWLRWFTGAALGALAVLPLAALVLQRPGSEVRDELLSVPVLSSVLLCGSVAVLSLAYLPYPFVYLSIPLMLAAVSLEQTGTALAALAVAVIFAACLAFGVLVPPPVTAAWQDVFVYLACAGALAPCHLLAAAMAQTRDGQSRLEQRTRDLKHANDRLEQFVHIASHDMREPLNTVTQFTGLIAEERDRLSPDAQRYLDLVQRSSGRMRTLLDDVLRYAQLHARDPQKPEPVALDELFADLRLALAGRIESSGAELRVGPLPRVMGNASLLSLMFQNLTANALKFMPPGRQPRIEVSARTEGDRVVVTVADNGIGIAEGDLGKLFRPFQRLNLRRKYEGTGLGLALCQQIAELHGGRIAVHSEPDRGSRFEVSLPAPPSLTT